MTFVIIQIDPPQRALGHLGLALLAAGHAAPVVDRVLVVRHLQWYFPQIHRETHSELESELHAVKLLCVSTCFGLWLAGKFSENQHLDLMTQLISHYGEVFMVTYYN